MTGEAHRPVLLEEAVGVLQPAPGMRIVDATFGRGGHTMALLSAGASVLALDRDPEAVAAGQAMAAGWGGKLEVRKMNFNEIGSLAGEHIDGVLMDLGVSSPQLACAGRGFSFQEDGPLDMRMDPESGTTAADLVNGLPEAELARLLWELGDERQSRKIAAALCRARAERGLTRTLEVAELVRSVAGAARHGKLHPATKTFQALRIAVNGELEALDSALAALPGLLPDGGRFAIISFHALEDRRVKQFIQHHSEAEKREGSYAFGQPNPDYCLKKLGRWKPSEGEIAANPRARSARLRAAEKLGNPQSAISNQKF